MPNEKPINERMINPKSYHRLYEVRAAEDKDSDGKMIVEGKAISFDDPTLLFKFGNQEIWEQIDRHALDEADISDCFLKYNHSDTVMPMARVRNGTLAIDVREDGAYIRAELANTTAGRDLYELVKRGDISKMSFAFTIKEERTDETKERITYTVMKIERLYDVAAVPLPAYDNTEIYARRFGDVETRRAELESKKEAELEILRKRAALK